MSWLISLLLKNRTIDFMKRPLVPLVVLLVITLSGALWLFRGNGSQLDPNTVEFHEDADRLIQGLHQYREFVGSYPTGSLLDISRALSGQTDKKILILATSGNKKNAKGEIIDPWGTPIQFYFGHNSVLIRSAGCNRIFEDTTTFGSDDLFKSEVD
jgi:hypothetical protein